ncbi:hypothetical protein JCM18899A_13870 [Nocardioides sp. AN3]
MAKAGVYITGLREITRAMEKAGVDVEELKDVMGPIAAEAARVMEPFIPKRSGALRASARPNRAKGKAIVTIGKARTAYAAPIQWGWPRRNIRPARFVERTDAVMETKAPEMLEQGWAEIVERHGLA